MAVETSALGPPSSSSILSRHIAMVAGDSSPVSSESGKRPPMDDLDVDDLAVAFDREGASTEEYNKQLTRRVLRKVDMRSDIYFLKSSALHAHISGHQDHPRRLRYLSPLHRESAAPLGTSEPLGMIFFC
jgi:hypothetical protein